MGVHGTRLGQHLVFLENSRQNKLSLEGEDEEKGKTANKVGVGVETMKEAERINKNVRRRKTKEVGASYLLVELS